MDFEQALVAAITEQFFKPIPGGFDMNGTQIWSHSPAQAVAVQLYQAKQKEILEAVTKAIDTDALAAQMAKQIVSDLQQRGSLWAATGDQFRKEVRVKVIEKLAAIQVAAALEEHSD